MAHKVSELEVLLVEPSHTQAKIIAQMLGAIGLTPPCASHTGRRALELIDERRPDVVLSAMYLPDMSGADLLGAVRERMGFDAVSFVLVSSETRDQPLEPVRQSGANAILHKPFGASDLAQALDACVVGLDGAEIPAGDFDISGVHVLVADDSRMARRAVTSMLRGFGVHEIDEAQDGAEAMTLIDTVDFDLVFTDYNMPNVDGLELLEFIRAHPVHHGLPVMMITTEGDAQKLAAIELAGVSAICDKPFAPETVRNFLMRVMH